jgi:hypothetical protein
MGKPAQAMIDLAADIAERLSLDIPDTEDFDEVADFIYLNKEEFYNRGGKNT